MNRKGTVHFPPGLISFVWTVGLFRPGSGHWQDRRWDLDVIWSAVENAGRLGDDWAKARWVLLLLLWSGDADEVLAFSGAQGIELGSEVVLDGRPGMSELDRLQRGSSNQ